MHARLRLLHFNARRYANRASPSSLIKTSSTVQYGGHDSIRGSSFVQSIETKRYLHASPRQFAVDSDLSKGIAATLTPDEETGDSNDVVQQYDKDDFMDGDGMGFIDSLQGDDDDEGQTSNEYGNKYNSEVDTDGADDGSVSFQDNFQAPTSHDEISKETHSGLFGSMEMDESVVGLKPIFSSPSRLSKDDMKEMTVDERAKEILHNFDPNSPIETGSMEDMQLWIECSAQQEAVRKYQEMITKVRDRKGFDSLGVLQRLIVKWYQDLRDAIDVRQKEYISNDGKYAGRKKYGPLLCSLSPEKLAVITSHEAIMTCLLRFGKSEELSVSLPNMTSAIANGVEVEALMQRRMREEYINRKQRSNDDDDAAAADGDGDNKQTPQAEGQSDDEPKTKSPKSPLDFIEVDRWSFSASHLQQFLDEMKRMNPDFKKNKRSIMYSIKKVKRAMHEDANDWNRANMTHLGAALLTLLIENAKADDGTPAFTLKTIWDDDKSKTFISMNAQISKMFLEDNINHFSATTNRHTPMIVPPGDWRKPDKGGYRWLRSDLMRYHGSHIQKEVLQNANLSLVYDGLNVLGQTPWSINKNILDVAQHCWNTNIAIGDIPSRNDFEVPPEPINLGPIPNEIWADIDDPRRASELLRRRKYREAVHKRNRMQQKNADLVSLRCSARLKLDQAEKFQDFERIYFPYSMDFRGRAYPIPPHMSNVGSDLCRGMLTFAESKPLGKKGMYWLKVHLANFAGKDKMSFDQRTQFVDDNLDKIRASVEDPFSEDPWWMTLEDPFQGLATCHEVIRAIDSGDPESYECNLPVHMDGSCNGLQHYAALGLDTVGGKAVNLLEGDGPQDVYVGVMHEVIRRVAEEALKDTLPDDTLDDSSLSPQQAKVLKQNRAAKLVHGLIDRGVVKRTVMTSVYGVTFIGAKQQILEKIEEKLEEKGHDIDEIGQEIAAASSYLASMTMEVMGELFQGARKTQNWLAECARLISHHGHPVAWISPIGVPVVQPYRQKKSSTILTALQSITIVDQGDDLPIHKSRQVTAFPPNYVHSLDSSHMLLTALEMNKRGLVFSAVHDSFWTHACDIDEMNVALRDCFVDLYSQPLLQDLKKSWELRYPDIDFPDLPELGDLDLNDVKSATYFFQ